MKCTVCNDRGFVDGNEGKGEWNDLPCPNCGEVNWLRKKLKAALASGRWTACDVERGALVLVPKQALYDEYCDAVRGVELKSKNALGRWLGSILPCIRLVTAPYVVTGPNGERCAAHPMPAAGSEDYSEALERLEELVARQAELAQEKKKESHEVKWLKLVQKTKLWVVHGRDQRKDDTDAVIVKKADLYTSYRRVGYLSYQKFLSWFKGVVPNATVSRRFPSDQKVSQCYRLPDPVRLRLGIHGHVTLLSPTTVQRDLETGFRQFYLAGHRHRVSFSQVWRGGTIHDYIGYEERLGYVRVQGGMGKLLPHHRAMQLLSYWGYNTLHAPTGKRV